MRIVSEQRSKMSILKVENLTFSYEGSKETVLKSLDFEIEKGELVLVCGKSGSGKTTLLRSLKPEIAPKGRREGVIEYCFSGNGFVGYLMQNTDAGIVTDKVWHELAFGLENQGKSQDYIRRKVAETVSFFGLSRFYHQETCKLSGGMKQLVSLASIMAMEPELLILDEPISQLDPVAVSDFAAMLKRIHDELGTTIIVSEHRLSELLPISSRVLAFDEGSIIYNGVPEKIADTLRKASDELYETMPSAVKIFTEFGGNGRTPLTVNACRRWLEAEFPERKKKQEISDDGRQYGRIDRPKYAVEIKNLSFAFERHGSYILHKLNLSVAEGEIHTVLGANGSGKTTLMSCIAGVYNKYTGRINTGEKRVALMPQNPRLMFVRETVREDFDTLKKLSGRRVSEEKADSLIREFGIERFMDRHPYDVSGGEIQKAAMVRLLMTEPDILLLDEPTKGMDGAFKKEFGAILKRLAAQNKTIVMVSHDIEFAARYSDRCTLLFDGEASVTEDAGSFFTGNTFYTTDAARIAAGFPENIITEEELIAALGSGTGGRKGRQTEYGSGSDGKKKRQTEYGDGSDERKKQQTAYRNDPDNREEQETEHENKAEGGTCGNGQKNDSTDECKAVGGKEKNSGSRTGKSFKIIGYGSAGAESEGRGKFDRIITVLTAAAILILIPLTVWFGVSRFAGRKYMFISLLILAEALFPVFLLYEHRKPDLIRLVTAATLCALTVAGRTAFYMVPNFKPVIAMVMLSGIAMGPFDGFMTGAVSILVSNIFFGQGPWTPWQMLTFGMIGFLAGLLGKLKRIRENTVILCVLGAAFTFVVFGGIMNPASVIMYQPDINKNMLLYSYVTGFPVDCIQAAATVIFLAVGAKPFLKKMDRLNRIN